VMSSSPARSFLPISTSVSFFFANIAALGRWHTPAPSSDISLGKVAIPASMGSVPGGATPTRKRPLVPYVPPENWIKHKLPQGETGVHRIRRATNINPSDCKPIPCRSRSSLNPSCGWGSSGSLLLEARLVKPCFAYRGDLPDGGTGEGRGHARDVGTARGRANWRNFEPSVKFS
jgi:hypothetical protein